MTRFLEGKDQRQFGRRKVLWHGWIKVPGRDREPCIVRNFSVAGALLEFEGAVPVASRFTLHIDAYRFFVECYVRHRSQTGIGVYFMEAGEGDVVPGRVMPQDVVARIRGEMPAGRP